MRGGGAMDGQSIQNGGVGSDSQNSEESDPKNPKKCNFPSLVATREWKGVGHSFAGWKRNTQQIVARETDSTLSARVEEKHATHCLSEGSTSNVKPCWGGVGGGSWHRGFGWSTIG